MDIYMIKRRNIGIWDGKPKVFQETDCNIWTDPYIQQQMLKEHLNPASDGATRRQESVQIITSFILNHSKSAARLLDLGCGPGVYTSLFRDKGFEITGIDFNKASIDYASNQRKDISYIYGDYISNYPAGIFDTVIMIYCDLGTHSDTKRDILLKNIYNSLNEEGVLIFDVFTQDIVNDKAENRNWDYAPEGGFWNDKEYLLLSQTFHYPEQKAFAYQYNLLTEEDNKHFIVWDRYYSGKEITEVLLHIGFNKVEIYKNVLDGNNFTSGSEMFVVASTS